MPRYEFYCEDCKKQFEIFLTLAEYEQDKAKCPKCGVNACTRRPPPSLP
jgi:putative FmdB family regulatory protein